MWALIETHSRLPEEPPEAAAHQQEELLGEEDPRDLLQRGLGLTPQVQDGGSQEGDAQAEAEERAPVCDSLPPVALKQRHDPLVQHVDSFFSRWARAPERLPAAHVHCGVIVEAAPQKTAANEDRKFRESHKRSTF